jgi:hypothetical protein
MTVKGGVVASIVDRTASILVVQIARKVPTQSPITSLRDRASRSSRNDTLTVLVDTLEQERSVLATGLPSIRIERIGSTVERGSSSRMRPVGKLVSIPVDDQVTRVGFPSLDTKTLGTADGLGETESDETDDSHEEEDDGDESDLFPPGSLSFPSVFACGQSQVMLATLFFKWAPKRLQSSTY